ncbi:MULTISPECIES: type III secretion system translocon subunit SctE [Parachlamydia]|uniref:type III secretion system translocon subunit SctE n=1 Tax=Parachlamydia TaxID=83551 RepID=UPI0001C17909|nr:type III secretion system translocon subunit SctE [Parachlamydia acanthamoebae]EFB41041.1 putative type III secretion translocator protein CopB [Parachlamydia acanthamoebae str. Hall's coccus]
MNEFNISSQGQQTNWNVATNETEGAKATVNVNQGAVIQDSLNQAEGTQTAKTYLQLPGAPALETPSGETVPFKQMTMSDATKLMSTTTQTPEEALNNFIKGGLAEAVLSGALSDTEAGQALAQYINPKANPKAGTNPKVQATLKQVVAQANQEAQQLTKQTPDQASAKAALTQQVQDQSNTTFDSAFKAAVKQAVSQMGLPKEQADQLIAKTIFAHEHPEAVTRSPDDLASQIEKQVGEQVKQEMGLPDDWQFTPETSNLDDKLATDYNSAYDAAISGDFSKIQSNPDLVKTLKNMSPQQLAQLKYAHYNPGTASQTGNLRDVNAQLESMILGSLINEYGFPPGWKPAVDNSAQNATIKGAYRAAFAQQVSNYAKSQTPPLTQDQIDQIMEAFDNPEVASPQMKALIGQLQQSAISSIRDAYGLPSDWTAPVGETENAMLDPFSAQVGTNAINLGKEMISQATTLALNLPNVPMKAEILDFMKAISDALTKLQEQIYLIQNQDASKAKELGKAELDKQLNKLAEQKKQMEDQRKSGKPGLGIFNSIMKVLGPISTVFSVVIAVLTLGAGAGLIGVAVAAAAIAYTVADQALTASGKQGVMGYAMQALTAAIKAAIPGPPALQMAMDMIIKTVAIVALTALVMTANPMVGMTVGLQAIGQATMQSNVIQNLVKLMGGDEMAQQITAMVLVTVATVVASLAFMVVTFFLQAELIPFQIAETVAKVAKTLVETLTKMASLAEKISDAILKIARMQLLDIAQIANQLLSNGLDAAHSAIEIRSQLQQAAQVLAKAELEADMQVLNAMIKLLRKIIDNLTAGMPAEAEAISEIGTLKTHIWQSQSQITTNIANAGAA